LNKHPNIIFNTLYYAIKLKASIGFFAGEGLAYFQVVKNAYLPNFYTTQNFYLTSLMKNREEKFLTILRIGNVRSETSTP